MNSDFSSDNPKVFGPIKWDVGQSLAIKATTKTKAEYVITIIWRDIVEDIRCRHCHDDALNYLNTHPFVWKDNKSAFRYIYDMHQWVNAKLGKPGITFEAAYSKYIDKSNIPCSAACRESASEDSDVSRIDTLPRLTIINLANEQFATKTNNSDNTKNNKVPIKFGRVNQYP